MAQHRDEEILNACFQHPMLGRDAWHQVHARHPINDGAKASLVCQFACTIRDQCPFMVWGEGSETIAGGGWFTARGQFVKPPDGMLEMHQAAAYVGVKFEYFYMIVREAGIKPTRGPSSLYYMHMTDVEFLAANHGPKHGSGPRYDLHLLRGEVPCTQCRVARRMEVQDASVLRRGVR